jgi:hypothetical protein
MQHVPVGVFRDITRPTYDDLVREQVDHAITTGGGPPTDHDIATLLAGNDTWTVNLGTAELSVVSGHEPRAAATCSL